MNSSYIDALLIFQGRFLTGYRCCFKLITSCDSGRQVVPALMILQDLQAADTPSSHKEDLVLNPYVNEMSPM